MPDLVDADLLKILCCPETHQPLSLASDDLVARVNALIAGGTLKNHAGQPVNERIDGGLVRQDQRVLYPIRRKIPILLIDEGLPVSG